MVQGAVLEAGGTERGVQEDLDRPLDRDRGLADDGEQPVAGGLEDLAGAVSADDLADERVVLAAEGRERLLRVLSKEGLVISGYPRNGRNGPLAIVLGR
ncbi:MAG: hypothetical protein ACRDHM_10895 [Actinomycetota bacterium]